MTGADIPWKFRFIIAAVYDLLDLTIFRIPGLGSVTDVFQSIFALYLFGAAGITASIELFDLSDQIDSFYPAMLISAILAYAIEHDIDVKDVKKIRGART